MLRYNNILLPKLRKCRLQSLLTIYGAISVSYFLGPLNCTALKSLDNGQFSTVHHTHIIQM
jgi:hypothetical protein